MIIGKFEEDEFEILPALGSKEGCVPTAVEDEEGVEKIIDELEIPVVGNGLEVKKDEEDIMCLAVAETETETEKGS
ncbi:hypothetical protein BGX20_000111 [Mortierella sp. AD010]|nr:hypothetical protein BGX20_000111 [Mortierella sp. AD010]